MWKRFINEKLNYFEVDSIKVVRTGRNLDYGFESEPRSFIDTFNSVIGKSKGWWYRPSYD